MRRGRRGVKNGKEEERRRKEESRKKGINK